MKTKTLSRLEQEVMNIVWERRDCSVRDVLKILPRKKKLAYTTIATVLNRLYGKGLVRRETQGSLIYYSPKISKEAYGKNTAMLFFRRFFSSFGDTAIASFAESIEKLPEDKKKFLLKLLKKNK